MSDLILSLSRITRAYGRRENCVSVLCGVNMNIYAGEMVALVGPSGSGKSTLLHIAGLLDAPTEGEICINGMECTNADDATRTALRLKHIGFVYQFHHLLPEFTALENIMIPQMLAGIERIEATTRAKDLLQEMGIASRAHHRPSEMSGGECQRVAIARALANSPALLLADEPTGNLDPATAETVFSLLMQLAKKRGLAALIATHNLDLASRMDRILQVEAGKVRDS